MDEAVKDPPIFWKNKERTYILSLNGRSVEEFGATFKTAIPGFMLI